MFVSISRHFTDIRRSDLGQNVTASQQCVRRHLKDILTGQQAITVLHSVSADNIIINPYFKFIIATGIQAEPQLASSTRSKTTMDLTSTIIGVVRL